MPKTVRIQLSSDEECSEAGKYAEEEEGGFRERQRRRSNASATAGAIKSILKHRPGAAENEVTSAVKHEERRASLIGGGITKKPLISVNGQEVNGDRRASAISILSSSSFSKLIRRKSMTSSRLDLSKRMTCIPKDAFDVLS